MTKLVQNLLPSQHYQLRVRSYDRFNTYSPWSEALEITTDSDSTIPKPPTNLIVSFQNGDMHLSWVAPTNNTDNSPCQDLAYYLVVIKANDLEANAFTYKTTNTQITIPSTNMYTDLSLSSISNTFTAAIKAVDTSANISTSLVQTTIDSPIKTLASTSSGTYTMSNADFFIVATGSVAFNLPYAINNIGKSFTIKNNYSISITVSRNSSDTIDVNSTSIAISSGKSLTFTSIGNKWITT